MAGVAQGTFAVRVGGLIGKLGRRLVFVGPTVDLVAELQLNDLARYGDDGRPTWSHAVGRPSFPSD